MGLGFSFLSRDTCGQESGETCRWNHQLAYNNTFIRTTDNIFPHTAAVHHMTQEGGLCIWQHSREWVFRRFNLYSCSYAACIMLPLSKSQRTLRYTQTQHKCVHPEHTGVHCNGTQLTESEINSYFSLGLLLLENLGKLVVWDHDHQMQ